MITYTSATNSTQDLSCKHLELLGISILQTSIYKQMNLNTNLDLSRDYWIKTNVTCNKF